MGGKVFLGEVKIDEKNLDKKSSITINGNIIEADIFVIACGPWNRKLFPEMLEDTTYISRQKYIILECLIVRLMSIT